MQCQLLASAMLHGNDFVKSVRNYRKTIIHENKNLRFLDEYPVFIEERRCAEAFWLRGKEGEQQERQLIEEESQRQRVMQRQYFDGVVDEAQSRRRTEGCPSLTMYFHDNDDEEWDIFIPAHNAQRMKTNWCDDPPLWPSEEEHEVLL